MAIVTGQDDVAFVTAVLAVPLAYVEFSGPKNNVSVLHQDSLLDTLQNAPKRLDKQQIARCAKALEMLEEAAAKVYRRAEPEYPQRKLSIP